MFRGSRRARFAATIGAALMLVALPAAAAELIGGLGGPAGFGVHRLAPGAHSTCALVAGDIPTPGPIDVRDALPHGIDFLDVGTSPEHTVLEICINENGTVSLRADHLGIPGATPTAFPQSVPMIAPFWGDVDSSGGTLDAPDEDAIYWDLRLGAITITWHNVGYDRAHSDRRNDFQLIFRSFSPECSPAAGAEFRYHRCEWTSGDRSGGTDGHGGIGAQAGFDPADGSHYYALSGSLTDSIESLCTTSNVGEPGVWRFRFPAYYYCNGGGARCDTGLRGQCALGMAQCHHSGDAVCDPLFQSSPELCNGLDDDCDGTVDFGAALCAAGYLCDTGECVPTCSGHACPPGQECTPNGGCVDVGCATVTCQAGSVCRNGNCEDSCASVVCPAGEQCHAGHCIDPCIVYSCPPGDVCGGRGCRPPCSCLPCQEGYSCQADGACRAADCVGVTCAPGQVCRSALFTDGGTAECVDRCDGVRCPQRQHCEAGECVYDTPVRWDGGNEDASSQDDTVAEGSAASDATIDAGDSSRPSTWPPSRTGCACRAPSGSQLGGGSLWVLWVLVWGPMRRRRRSQRYSDTR